VASIEKWVTGGLLAGVMALVVATPTAQGATREAKKKADPKAIVVLRNKQHVTVHAARRSASRHSVAFVPAKPSFGQIYGLHSISDSLDLKSGVALVLDQDTNEVLFSKNSEAVLPIASLTKLMTALVVTEANQPLDELITVSQDDIDTEKGSRSRLVVGTQLRREEMLHLALMSSENRKAHDLGMNDTHYVEPTGLSSKNQSSAHDLAILVKAAHEHQIIRELSTSQEYSVEIGHRELQFRNTNGLVRSPAWDIGLQKTGYITEAGRCLVMQAKMAGRKLIMVFLDSAGKYSRIGDAERVRRWISQTATRTAPAATEAAPLVPVATELPKLSS